MTDKITLSDRERLRETAREQLEWHHSPHNQEVLRRWKRHGAFQPGNPMVHLEIWGFEQDLLAPRLRCEGAFARAVEAQMLRQFLNQKLYADDRPVPDHYPVYWRAGMTPFDLRPEKKQLEGSQNGLGETITPIINDLEEDYHLLKPSTYGVDRAGSLQELERVSDLIGDILPVQMEMNALYFAPTQDIVRLMGMENMMFAMMDAPELFLEMMNRYANDALAYLKFLEDEKLLLPTTGAQQLAQGTRCFTDELPEQPTSTREVWGFLDSQETVAISPAMFEELVFPCYKKIADAYGLLSYGCCEPVDRVWNCISSLENLRKVSVSPWCSEAFMGEQLRGKKIVYLRKPSPNFLMSTGTLDEDAVRAHIADTLRAAEGCTLEFAQRDVYKCDDARGRRYVQLIREEIEKHWKP